MKKDNLEHFQKWEAIYLEILEGLNKLDKGRLATSHRKSILESLDCINKQIFHQVDPESINLNLATLTKFLISKNLTQVVSPIASLKQLLNLEEYPELTPEYWQVYFTQGITDATLGYREMITFNPFDLTSNMSIVKYGFDEQRERSLEARVRTAYGYLKEVVRRALSVRSLERIDNIFSNLLTLRKGCINYLNRCMVWS
jgi:hypothetical protein